MVGHLAKLDCYELVPVSELHQIAVSASDVENESRCELFRKADVPHLKKGWAFITSLPGSNLLHHSWPYNESKDDPGCRFDVHYVKTDQIFTSRFLLGRWLCLFLPRPFAIQRPAYPLGALRLPRSLFQTGHTTRKIIPHEAQH